MLLHNERPGAIDSSSLHPEATQAIKPLRRNKSLSGFITPDRIQIITVLQRGGIDDAGPVDAEAIV